MNTKQRSHRRGEGGRPYACAISVPLLLSASIGVQAMQLDVGNPDVALRWDNTIKYSAAARVKSPNDDLLSSPNLDDGDRNFGKGMISSRFDLLSELDFVYKRRVGFRVSAAAWHDSFYTGTNDNPGFAGGAYPNNTSVAYNRFTDSTRKVHGRYAEVLDAFVFSKFDIGDMPLTVRAGRHSLVWGESLFFGVNAMAGGQMPVDAVKLVSVPGTQFKEAIRPVPMVSAEMQLNSRFSLGAYYQTRSSETRLPEAGSYFSNADIILEGADSMLLGPGPFPQVMREGTQYAKNSGQWGLQLKIRGDETDYGFYVMQFHSKTPQVIPRLGLAAVAPGVMAAMPTSYGLAYHENIRAIGASASRTFGNYNVAAELSFRNNQDLASTRGVNDGFFTGQTYDSKNPAYAVGRTAHLNISVLGNLPKTFLWNEATVTGEIAWNRVLRITKNADAVDPNATRNGLALRVLVEPTYRQVLPGLDLSVPIGLSYAPKGSRPMAMNPNAWIPEGGGDLSIGVSGVYLDAWRFSLNYTHYFGSLKPFQDANNNYTYGQSLKDRDFVSFSLRHTF